MVTSFSRNRRYVRVVKESDLKSDAVSAHRFKPCCRRTISDWITFFLQFYWIARFKNRFWLVLLTLKVGDRKMQKL